MPRGKHVKKNKRNENFLTTQLMRISLRMDDHIYDDRRIAAAEAARFLQEIATLKLQCLPTNTRALQVIEKLTRLMSNILTEEDGGRASSSFNESLQINTEFTGSASPVYSLPDEDRINDIYEQTDDVDLDTTGISDGKIIHEQTTHCYGQNSIATGFADSASPVYDLTVENKMNYIYGQNLNTGNLNISQIPHKEMYLSRGLNINTSNKQDYITISLPGNNATHPNNTIDNGEVIDIINDSDVKEANEIVAVSNKKSVSIEHVSSGISHMAIYDVGNETKLANDDVNCSHSILENDVNDNQNEAAANKKHRVVENKPYNEKNAKACIMNKVNNYFLRQSSLAVMSSREILADSQPTNVDFNTYNKPATQDAILQENNKMGMKKKVGNEKDKPKKRRTKKNIKPKKNKAAPNCVQNDLNATLTYKDVTNKSYNNKEYRPNTVKKSRKLKKIHEIYKENVENDLSWVENLRYVREICPSEYDPTLSMLQDDFWDNFDLPGTWNDLDFEV